MDERDTVWTGTTGRALTNVWIYDECAALESIWGLEAMYKVGEDFFS